MRAFRCRACPSSSRMTAAAPSATTQPSRRRSKGLEAAGPSSLRAVTASRPEKAEEVFSHLRAPAARTEVDPRPLGEDAALLERSVLPRQVCGTQPHRLDPVRHAQDSPPGAVLDHRLGIEVLDDAADLRSATRDVEAADRPDPALATTERVEHAMHVMPEGGDDPKPCDDD